MNSFLISLFKIIVAFCFQPCLLLLSGFTFNNNTNYNLPSTPIINNLFKSESDLKFFSFKEEKKSFLACSGYVDIYV
jgi:hypothetical protein